MLRMFGDNGKLNDNMLMHVLSPYPAHRSALTDCQKLVRSALPGRKAIVVFGYGYNDWPWTRRSKRPKARLTARCPGGQACTGL